MSTRFTALTIKEGDAFLLEDNGWNCLFDSGVNESIVDLLKHKDINKLDLAICSHNDADHANGFIALLESNLQIDEIWLPYWWASILEYSNNHDIDWEEIKVATKKMNKSKIKKSNSKSLFSDKHEPLSDDEFNRVLTNLAKRYKDEKSTKVRIGLYNYIIKCIDKKIEKRLDKELRNLFDDVGPHSIKEIAHAIKHGIADIVASQDVDAIFDQMNDEIAHIRVYESTNNGINGIDERIDYIAKHLFQEYVYFLVHNKRHSIHNLIVRLLSHYANNQITQKITDDIIRDITGSIIHDITDNFGKNLSSNITIYSTCASTNRSKYDIISCLRQGLKQDFCRFFLRHENEKKAEAKNSPKIKFDNIMEIAILAHSRKCTIKWFEPTRDYTNNRIPGTQFIAINSTLKRQIQVLRPKEDEGFAMLLYLTEVNQYSLVFEYLKDGIPIVRFSADSDCKCSSQSPYEHSIIVTAPHHGAKANAKVYSAIKGKDIIWVRSDKISGNQGRPCDDFKSMKNRYCLACDKYNFESEICFEYDPWLKQWNRIRGERCRCNKNQQ